ncbi:MAG: DUF2147 domain-containing protein [Parvibaculum sp.]
MYASDALIVAAVAFVAVASCFALTGFASAGTEAPVGYWRVIDDRSDTAKGIIEIREVNGALEGRMVKLLDREGKDPNPTCDGCPGDRKGQPIQGMTVLWGLERQDDQWAGGTILDPSSGDTYDAAVKLAENGKELDVRGYIGFSLLGRTQVWERVDEPAGQPGNK